MAKKVTEIESVDQKYARETIPVLRARVYCRVSTRATEQKDSLEAQVQCYGRVIQGRDGQAYANIYTDKARSGTKLTGRDEPHRMLQGCRLGKTDLILMKSVAWFARNTVDSIRAIRQLEELGIGVCSGKERVNTLSEKDEQLLMVLSSITQGGSESISTNNRWVIARRFQNGTYAVSLSAYGYVNDENEEPVVGQEEAVIVRKIFDSYLGGRDSYIIVREPRQGGLPTIRYPKGWQDSVVKGILQNPVYEGDLLQQKTYATEGVSFVKGCNYRQLPQYLIKDNHEAIITREEAETVRQLYEHYRQEQRAEDRTIYQSRYVFSSRTIYEEYGPTSRRQKIYIGKPYKKVWWSCHQHIEDISRYRQRTVWEDGVKRAFVQLWSRLASNYETILLPLLPVLETVPGGSAQERGLEDPEKRIQGLREQSHMLRKVFMDGDISSAVSIEQRNQMGMELERAYHRQ